MTCFRLYIPAKTWQTWRRMTEDITFSLHIGTLRPRPHISVFIWKKQFFLYGYGFHPHVSYETDQWKRNFSKTLSRVELFENAIFACTWRQTQTELFENAEVTLSVPSHSAQYKKLIQDGGRGVKHAQSGKLSFSNRFIVYVWTGENDAKTLRVDADFLKTEKKKLRFQTNTDTCWQGLRSNDATATRACKTKQ